MVPRQLVTQMSNQPRFADAGLTAEKYDLSFPLHCLAPATQDKRRFVLSAYELD
jgi:hypothetical protein